MARFSSLNRLIKGNKGFTYFELIAGVGVLMIVITAFLGVYRVSRTNKAFAHEMVAMAQVAQNMAEVYKATSGDEKEIEDAVLKEAEYEGFKNEKVLIMQEKDVPKMYLTTVTITVKPRIMKPAMEDFVLQFYVLDKSKIRLY